VDEKVETGKWALRAELTSTFANTKQDPKHPIRYNFTPCGCIFMS